MNHGDKVMIHHWAKLILAISYKNQTF
jgi:hypothetical protein